ncbi:hypothetical protein [Kineosporia sp. A_224]|uniref:hypothetical protein n=1 Tax=Kineosporia sp. A_224 TaxID=1962180 RepID=UPI000B4BF68A|nr:hypothetical protein [Kineosporia sp. A_224]
MSEWDAVGGDPSPGDVTTVDAQAVTLATVAGHGDDLRQRLEQALGGLDDFVWTGVAAEATRTTLGEVLPPLVEFWSAHQDASAALRRYADELAQLQSRARTALDDHTTATAKARSLERQAGAADTRAKDAWRHIVRLGTHRAELVGRQQLTALAGGGTADLDAEIARVDDETETWRRIREDAHEEKSSATALRADADEAARGSRLAVDAVRRDHEEARLRAAHAVLAAVGASGGLNGLLGRVQATAVGLRNAAVDAIDSELADSILTATERLAAVLGTAATVCAVLSLVPVVGAAFAAAAGVLDVAALGLGAVVLVGRLLRALNGADSWATVGGAALSVVPGGFGRALKTVARTTKSVGTLSAIKRLLHPVNASHMTTQFWRRTVYVAPKLKGFSPWMTSTFYTLKVTSDLVQYGVHVHDATHSLAEAAQDPTADNLRQAYTDLDTVADDDVDAILAQPARPGQW